MRISNLEYLEAVSENTAITGARSDAIADALADADGVDEALTESFGDSSALAEVGNREASSISASSSSAI